MLNPREMFTSYQDKVSADSVILKNTSGIYITTTFFIPVVVFMTYYFSPNLQLESASFLITMINALFLSVILANWIVDSITSARLEAIGFKNCEENAWRSEAFYSWQKQMLRNEILPLGYYSSEKRIDAYQKYIDYADNRLQNMASPYFKPAVILAAIIPVATLVLAKAFALTTTQFQFFGTILVLISMTLAAAAIYLVGKEPLSTLFDSERRQLQAVINILDELAFEEEAGKNQHIKPTMVSEVSKQEHQPRLGIPKAIGIS